MSGQQQHQSQRYGHSYGHHSHAHSQAYAHSHHHDADPDNHGGMDGYADIDDEMAMLGYHHPGGPSPLDDYHYPDRPAVADAGPTHGQYQQRLIYLQQHQHQQRAAAAAAAAQAQAQAHAAASACGPPPEHAQPNGWHSHAQLHLHHHHPPGYGRHLHSHVAAAAAATARCAPYPPQPARRSVTGSPVLANDQRQHQMHTLKGSAVPAASPTTELAPTNGTDARSHQSSSQRSGHFAHRSPSASASSTSAQVAPPASARTQHALAHNHHPLPRRPRVHHASDSATSKSAQAPTSITPNQSPAISRPLDPTSSASESNGYQPSGSGSGSGGRSSSGNSSARSPRTTRATRAAESRSTAAHEGSATSTDSSSSADLARVPASTTSSSGSSSTNTKSQSATSSAPETVPEPPVPPPQQLPAAQGKRVRAGNEPAAGQVQPAGGLASATKQSVPPAALQLTKDRAWAQSVIEHVSDMVLSLAPNGTIVWASPSARKVIGFNAAELAGRHLGEFVHPEDAQLLTRTLTASIAQSTAAPTPSNTPSNGATSTPRDSSFDVTVRFRRKNADYFLIHVTGRALLVSNSAATAAPEYPGLMTSPASATFASSTQPFAPQPQPLGIPAAPGIGLHPFSLPYNPGNLMAAAAALATASPLHTFPTATPAAASRPPPLLVAICREYPLGDHANQLDEVVGLRFENEMLREKLAAGYARRGTSPPVDSSLRRSVGGEVGIKLTEIVLPAANGVATEGHRVSVPVGAGDGAGAATSVGKKGMSAAVVPSDILRVAVERGVVPRAGAAAAAVDAAGEGDGEEADGTEGAGGKARGKAKKKRKLNGIKPNDERVCIDCGVTSSSEWRKGPMGAKTLCNACGLRYAKRKKDEAAARARAMADQASTSASSTDPLTSGLDAASSSTNSTSPPATASMLAESSASSTPPAPSGSHADQAMDTTGG